jgi:hypothetical protein
MSRRAFRPQFEAIEDRVLTTVAGSQIGSRQVERSGWYPEHGIYAYVDIHNYTNQDIKFQVIVQLGHGEVETFDDHLLPHDGMKKFIPVTSSSLVPGTLPHYSVTYQPSPGRRVTVPITPDVYDHRLTYGESRSIPSTASYVFTKNSNGDSVLIQNKARLNILVAFDNTTPREIEVEVGYKLLHDPNGSGRSFGPFKSAPGGLTFFALRMRDVYDVVPIFTATYNASPHHSVTQVVNPGPARTYG